MKNCTTHETKDWFKYGIYERNSVELMKNIKEIYDLNQFETVRMIPNDTERERERAVEGKCENSHSLKTNIK